MFLLKELVRTKCSAIEEYHFSSSFLPTLTDHEVAMKIKILNVTVRKTLEYASVVSSVSDECVAGVIKKVGDAFFRYQTYIT